MVLAIIVGILVGAVSLIPFGFITRRLRKIDPTKALSLLGTFLIPIAISFVILVVALVICRYAVPDVIIPYAIAEIVAFIVGVIIFGIIFARRQRQ